jgi:thiamine monophosphate synthase
MAWDGGANLANVTEIAHSGIDVINVGAAISRSPQPEQAFSELQLAANR